MLDIVRTRAFDANVDRDAHHNVHIQYVPNEHSEHFARPNVHNRHVHNERHNMLCTLLVHAHSNTTKTKDTFCSCCTCIRAALSLRESNAATRACVQPHLQIDSRRYQRSLVSHSMCLFFIVRVFFYAFTFIVGY